ncbi:hypothetical protein GCM10009856_27090 [Mycolicibacterium llatzerense]
MPTGGDNIVDQQELAARTGAAGDRQDPRARVYLGHPLVPGMPCGTFADYAVDRGGVDGDVVAEARVIGQIHIGFPLPVWVFEALLDGVAAGMGDGIVQRLDEMVLMTQGFDDADTCE